MKAQVILDKLNKGVAMVEKLAEKNPSLPILECILFVAKENTLFIRTTNLHTGVEIKIPAKIEKEGEVAVSAHIITRVLQSLGRENNAEIYVEDNTLHIRTKHSSIKINTQDSSDFPTLPKNSPDNVFTIKAEKLLDGFRAVSYSAANTEIKPEISSVYIYPEEDFLVFVATDSFRLAEKKIKISSVEDFPGTIIPIKNVREIMRICAGIEGELEVVVSASQISFSNQEVYIISRIIEGSFPDYKQIIPNESSTEIVFLKKDISDAFRVIEPFSDDYNQITLAIDAKKEECRILAKNKQTGESEIEIDAKIGGEDSSVKFNYSYFTEGLSSIGGDSLVFRIQPGKPIVIEPVHDEGFKILIMPINR